MTWMLAWQAWQASSAPPVRDVVITSQLKPADQTSAVLPIPTSTERSLFFARASSTKVVGVDILVNES